MRSDITIKPSRDVETIVRSATLADLPAVLVLMRELAVHEDLAQYFSITTEDLARYCFGSPARAEVLVAELDGALVGFASLMNQLSLWRACDYLFLDDLYVAANMRGKGVGSRLLDAVAALAVARNVDVRWHVEKQNTSAAAFYQSVGALLREKYVAYWTREVMVKRLRP